MWRAIALLMLPTALQAETLIAARTLPARSVISSEDLAVDPAPATKDGLQHPQDALGLETRRTIFAGRALRHDDLVKPARVERNSTITLIYTIGDLRITSEGRALARGSIGEVIRVMNLASRNTVFGTIQADGTIHVGEPG